jgi:hypothetical protein
MGHDAYRLLGFAGGSSNPFVLRRLAEVDPFLAAFLASQR